MLQGVQEHYKLKFSQLVRGTHKNIDHYTYYEHGSKNLSGGINDYSDGKAVTIVDSGLPRSHVFLLNLYMSKVPKSMKAPDGKFYLMPLPFTPTGSSPWYFTSLPGINKIQTMVKELFRDADIAGNLTNHSLRATGATTLFEAGVPEALIQKHNGQKSTKALCMYEHVTPAQDLAISKILHSAIQLTYGDGKNATTKTAKRFDEYDPELCYTEEELKIFECQTNTAGDIYV